MPFAAWFVEFLTKLLTSSALTQVELRLVIETVEAALASKPARELEGIAAKLVMDRLTKVKAAHPDCFLTDEAIDFIDHELKSLADQAPAA